MAWGERPTCTRETREREEEMEKAKIVMVQSAARGYLTRQRYVQSPRAEFEMIVRELDGTCESPCEWPRQGSLCCPSFEMPPADSDDDGVARKVVPEVAREVLPELSTNAPDSATANELVHTPLCGVDTGHACSKISTAVPATSSAASQLAASLQVSLKGKSIQDLLVEMKYAQDALQARVRYLKAVRPQPQGGPASAERTVTE